MMTLDDLQAWEVGAAPAPGEVPPPLPPSPPPLPHLAMLEVTLGVQCDGGRPLPARHAYPLFAALCHTCPWIHSDPQILVSPLQGMLPAGRDLLRFTEGSRLLFRAPPDKAFLLSAALTSARVEVMDRTLCFGVAEVGPVVLGRSLYTEGVFISKSHRTRAPGSWSEFLESLTRQLDELGVSQRAVIVPGRRVAVRVKGYDSVGYAVGLRELTPGDASALMFHGLGGRRHHGGGFMLRGELPSRLALEAPRSRRRVTP